MGQLPISLRGERIHIDKQNKLVYRDYLHY